MKTKRNFSKKLFSMLIVFTLILSMLPIQSFAKTAFDPKEDHKQLDLRFWEDEQPDIGFYINASSRYILETVTEPKMGSTFGEWSVMDLLRGMYTGYDYINYIPENYFEKYLQGIEGYVIGKKGELDRNKSTEWSRLILALSSLGYDITNVGTPGDYFLTYATWNTGIVNAVPISENSIVLKNPEKIHLNALNEKTNKYTNQYVEFPAGKYSLDQEANTITDESGNVFNLSTVNQFITIEKGYDFIEKLSQSYKFSYRQGINGPIWVTIAMNTGGYELYEDETNADVNTVGKAIGYVLSKEITQKDGTVGGWALSGASPDPDITGMALQALAPYYLDRTKFEAELVSFVDTKGNKVKDYTYEEFAQAVERAIYVLSLIQKENGGYASWGTVNSESIVQVIVALTALDIDPLQENIELKHIGKTFDFITEGKEHEGVFTNNMIDALLTFWANGSGSSPEVGGFKHVTAGYDGGGGSGTGVNAMATDQALYGLIAYDRFLKGENDLYDMTDMTGGQYKNMTAKEYSVNYVGNSGDIVNTGTFSPYEVIKIPDAEQKEIEDLIFANWNTKADGSGAAYKPGEYLSTPEQDITLYAQYKTKDQIAADSVTAEINLLPSTEELTLEEAEKIASVRESYNNLTEAQKELVKNYETLQALENKLLELSATDEDWEAAVVVMDEIDKLPSIEELTLEDEVVAKARNSFNSLTDVQKVLVKNYKTLLALEQRIAELLEPILNQQAADKAIEAINSLPQLADLKLSDKANVDSVSASFESLTEVQKALVTNSEKLEALKQRIEELTLDAINQQAADNVIAKIDQLPSLEEADEDHLSAIEDARVMYDALTDVQKQLVTNTSKLIELEQRLADKEAAKNVMDAIDGLPLVLNLTLQDESAIKEVRNLYDSMTEVRQALVSNYGKLQALEQRISELSAPVVTPPVVTPPVVTSPVTTDQQVADEVIQAINALPQADALTLKDETTVESAVALYSELTEAQKQLVNNYGKLQTLQNALKELKQPELERTFKDVAKEHTFYNEINYLVNKSIIVGFADGTFKPEKSVTRAEAAIMIGRALGLNGDKQNTSFKDVSSASTASGYIKAAVDAGIIQGFPDGTYRPDETVTREQMAILLARAFQLNKASTVSFKDVSENSVAYKYIGLIKEAGITVGYNDNTFKPTAEVTRGQFSAFLSRALTNGENEQK